MRFQTREGTVLSIQGQIATIKLRNGRLDWHYLTSLRLAGQKTALTEAVEEGFTAGTQEGQ